VAFKLWIKTYRQALKERDRAMRDDNFEGF
jgi:hypothetical protein